MVEEDVLLKRAEKARKYIEFLYEISGEYDLEDILKNYLQLL